MRYDAKYSAGSKTTPHFWKQPDPTHDEHMVGILGYTLTQDYRDYGVAIGPERMRYFLDQVKFFDIPTPPASGHTMTMLADLALGGGYSKGGRASPAVTQIRAYRDRSGSP